MRNKNYIVSLLKHYFDNLNYNMYIYLYVYIIILGIITPLNIKFAIFMNDYSTIATAVFGNNVQIYIFS